MVSSAGHGSLGKSDFYRSSGRCIRDERRAHKQDSEIQNLRLLLREDLGKWSIRRYPERHKTSEFYHSIKRYCEKKQAINEADNRIKVFTRSGCNFHSQACPWAKMGLPWSPLGEQPKWHHDSEVSSCCPGRFVVELFMTISKNPMSSSL